MSFKRPEHVGPPELFYNATEAKKYTCNSHIISTQATLSERALELLALPDDHACLLLDIGCGSGLSGEGITETGHYWVGIDISEPMLEVALEREVEGDLILSDMGNGVPFRAGSFDGAISISALQWLCNADTKEHHPPKRLYTFFSSLYAALSRGSRAVFQFYPENSAQVELITQQAIKAGFFGGVVVDFPHSTRAKKMYLVLFTGGYQALPKGLDEENARDGVRYSGAQNDHRDLHKSKHPKKKSKQWILDKKERARRQGKDVRPDSKYTGRRRKHKF